LVVSGMLCGIGLREPSETPRKSKATRAYHRELGPGLKIYRGTRFCVRVYT
jgi:hypothetical protein